MTQTMEMASGADAALDRRLPVFSADTHVGPHPRHLRPCRPQQYVETHDEFELVLTEVPGVFWDEMSLEMDSLHESDGHLAFRSHGAWSRASICRTRDLP